MDIRPEDLFPEKRCEDVDNETVVFQAGFPRGMDANRVWFCRVTKRGITVEDYAATKRAALRLARRAWTKVQAKQWKEQYGYPRLVGD